MNKAACLVLFAWMGGFFTAAQEPTAWGIWQEKLDPPRLEVEVRWNAPVQMTSMTARAGTQALPVTFTAFDQSDEGKVAVLFLIDRSDPQRARTVEAAKALTLRLIESADARVQCAIYAFNSELVPIADWRVPRDDLAARLKPLKPSGMATELYRNVIEAARILERSPIRRRALVILSDGKAEDTTFTLEQAIEAAKMNSRAWIFAVGYAETPQTTVHLQSLRQFAAATHGRFIAADVGTKNVPSQFVDEFMPVLTAGGFGVVDMKGVRAREVVCEWVPATLPQTNTNLGPLKIFAPLAAGDQKVEEMASTVQLAVKKMEQLTQEQAAAREAARMEEAIAQQREAERAARSFKGRLLGGAALLLLLLIGSILLIAKRHRRAPALGATPAVEDAPVFARLQILDGDGSEHLMRTTALRVGRGKDNDLQLGNDSVSRHHAEISRTREGAFTITELNAGNGVLVNGEAVEKATLKNEDVIELGEVRIRFLVA